MLDPINHTNKLIENFCLNFLNVCADDTTLYFKLSFVVQHVKPEDASNYDKHFIELMTMNMFHSYRLYHNLELVCQKQLDMLGLKDKELVKSWQSFPLSLLLFDMVLLQMNYCYLCRYALLNLRSGLGLGVVKVWGHSLLPVLLEWLFCRWRWGLSDKAGRDERRRANTGLSSEQIQFHSINIDVQL